MKETVLSGKVLGAISVPNILRTALTLIGVGLVWVGLLGTTVAPAPASATSGVINKTINYQGRLLTASGAVVADGNYNMQFKIYQDGNGCVGGGTSPCSGTLMWTESWVYGTNAPDNRVVVKNGYFSVNLGSICPVDATTCTANTGNSQTNTVVDFNQSALWLTMNIENTAHATDVCPTFTTGVCSGGGDGEMLPMKRMASAVYALQAQSANTCVTCILQAPTSTAQNTITPASGQTGLTVNGAAGTAATAISVVQTGAADAQDISFSGAANTALAVTANSLTTGTGVSVSSTGTGLTSGSLLSVSSATTGAVASNGIVSLQATGNYTSTSNVGLLNVVANSTTGGTVSNIQGNALTTGNGLVVSSTGTGLTTGSLFSVSSATTGAVATNGIVSVNATGNYTSTSNVGLLNLTANSTTAGTVENNTANALTTGVADNISSTGVGLTSGSLLRVTSATAGALATNGIVSLNASGNYTSTSNVGLLNVAANSTAAGTVANIQGNALTTGVGLNVSSSGIGLTTGSLLNVASATTGAINTNGIVSFQASGNYTSTGNFGLVNALANSTAAGTIENVQGNALTTGVGISVSSTGVGLTTGSLLRATSATTGAVNTNGIVSLQATGNYTSTSNNGLLDVLANSTVAGTAALVQANALTTGNGLVVNSSGTGLTSGSLLNVTTATTGAVATNGVVSLQASGNYTSTAGIGLLSVLANATTAGTIEDIQGNAITTGNALSIASTGTGLTTGSLINVSSATTGAVATNGIVSLNATGNYTSTAGIGLLSVLANSTTAGTIENIQGNALTTGNAVTISSTGAGLTSGSLLSVSTATTGAVATNGVISLQATANYTSTANIGLLSVLANSTAAGTIQDIQGNALTTGTALSVASTGTGLTSGSLINVSTATTAALATNGVVSLNATGNYTSTSNAALLNLTANSTTGGTIQNIQGTGLTTGTALNINAGAGKALNAVGSAVFQTSTNSVTAFQIQNASGNAVANVDTTNPITDVTNNQVNNEVTNGSFEGATAVTGWVKTGAAQVAVAQDTTEQYIGNSAMKVVTTNADGAGTDGATYNLSTSTLVSNTRYTMSFVVKNATANTNWTTMEIGRAEDGATKTACLTAQTVTSDWKQYTCTFTTGTTSSTPYIYIRETDASTHTFWVDGVYLTRWSILPNASVEQAIAGNWTKKNGAETTFAQSGTNWVDGKNSLNVVTQAVANEGAKTNITLNDSTNYTVTFQAMATASFSTMAAGYSSDGSTDGNICMTAQTVGTGWDSYTCTFTTPASHSGTPFFFIKQTDAVVHTFYIDAVQLTNGNPLSAYQEGQLQVNATLVSPLTLQNTQNSTTALQVLNSAGGQVASVDTTQGGKGLVANAPNSATVGVAQAAPWEAWSAGGATKVQISPHAVGNLIVIAIAYASTGNNVAQVTSPDIGNGGHYVTTIDDATNGRHIELWEGVVTATTATQNVNVTWAGLSAPVVNVDYVAQEFAAGLGSGAVWSVTSAATKSNAASATVTYPTLTPTMTGELYWGYAFTGSTFSSGASTGFTYNQMASNTAAEDTYNTYTTAGSAYAPTYTALASASSDTAALVISASAGLALSVQGVQHVMADSDTAFQVQNTAGQGLLTVDTTMQRVWITSPSNGLSLQSTTSYGENGIWFLNSAGTLEGEIGTAFTAGQIVTGSAVNDFAVKSPAGNILLAAGGLTPELKIASTGVTVASGGLTVTSGTTSLTGALTQGTGAVTLSGNASSSFDASGTLSLGTANATAINIGGNTSNVLTEKVANSSTTAYNLQTAGGTAYLTVDSTNKRITVAKGSTGESAGVSAVALVLDSSDTSPTAVNGAMYYNTTDNTFMCGVNSAWTSCGNGVMLALNGSFPDVTNASAYTAFTGATFTPPAGDCQAGVTYLINAGGYTLSATSGTSASKQMDFALYQNGTDIEDLHNEATLTSVADTNNHSWTLNLTVTCQGSNNVMISGFTTSDGNRGAGWDSPAGNARTGNVAITDNTAWVLRGRWNGGNAQTSPHFVMTTCIVQRLAP